MASTNINWNEYHSSNWSSGWRIYTTNSTVSNNTDTNDVEVGAEDGYRVFYNVSACPAKKKEPPKKHPVELF